MSFPDPEDTRKNISVKKAATFNEIEGVDYTWEQGRDGAFVREDYSMENYNYLAQYSLRFRVMRLCTVLLITFCLCGLLYYFTMSVTIVSCLAITGISIAYIIFRIKSRSLY